MHQVKTSAMHLECSFSALSVARGFAVDLTVYACSASGATAAAAADM